MTVASSIFWHVASPGQPVLSLALPPKLFYVRHGCSQAYPTLDGGFISRAPYRNLPDNDKLRRNATMHFEWRNRDWDSCFVSAFADQAHAESWGRKLSAQHEQPATVYELDTSQLPPGTVVLNAWLLCSSFGIGHPWNDGNDEYLFYKGIPGSCVARCWDPWWGYAPQVGVPSPRSRGLLSNWADVITVAEQAQVIHKAQWAINNRGMGPIHQEHYMPLPLPHQTSITPPVNYYGMETHQEHPVQVPLPVPVQPLNTASVVEEILRGIETHQGHHGPLPLPHQTSMSMTTSMVQPIQEQTNQSEEWLTLQNATGKPTNTVDYPNLEVDDLRKQMKGLDLNTDVSVQPSPAMSDTAPKTSTKTVPTTSPNTVSNTSTALSITITEANSLDPTAVAGTSDVPLGVESAAKPASEKQKKKTKSKTKATTKKERKARNAPG